MNIRATLLSEDCIALMAGGKKMLQFSQQDEHFYHHEVAEQSGKKFTNFILVCHLYMHIYFQYEICLTIAEQFSTV